MRNCCIIIEKIIKEIPTNKKDFIADLKFNYKAASYTVPEDNAKWLSRLQTTVNKHIINPTEDWEIKVLSILMDIYENEVRHIIYYNTYQVCKL